MRSSKLFEKINSKYLLKIKGLDKKTEELDTKSKEEVKNKNLVQKNTDDGNNVGKEMEEIIIQISMKKLIAFRKSYMILKRTVLSKIQRQRESKGKQAKINREEKSIGFDYEFIFDVRKFVVLI